MAIGVYERFLDILLPEGGLVSELVEMYLDESERDQSILCIGGYLLRKEQAEALQPLWREALAQHNLSHFHMVDCAHGNEEYADISANDRIKLQTRLFALLKEHIECGYSYSFDLEHADLCPNAVELGRAQITPYTLCAYFCLHGARHWAKRSNFGGEIAYIFEAGHSSQGQASALMDQIFRVPSLREFFQYAGHAFIPKKKAAGLQCADILVWQWGKNRSDKKQGITRNRKDLLSLLDKPHFCHHFDRASLVELNKSVLEKYIVRHMV